MQMAFQTRTDLQNQAIGWLRKGCRSLGGGTVVRFPRFWMSSGECWLMVPRQSNELEFRVWRPVILFFAQLSGPRMSNVKRTIKYMLETPLLGILSWLPLKLRMQLAISLGRRNRLLGRSWLASLCVNDLRITRPNDFHKFLWNNHLFYAATYEIEQRFGAEKQKEPRRIFFSHLLDHLRKLDVAPERIQSVFEVGCSMG